MDAKSCQLAGRASGHLPAFFTHCLLSLFLLIPTLTQAQLVADGQTNVLDNVATNLTGGIIVGTNGSFTLLVITDGATVTNTSGNAVIGLNSAAQSNQVTITGTGSSWSSAADFHVGDAGSFNELDILGGGNATAIYNDVGYQAAASNNVESVSDAGSLFQSTYVYVGLSSGGNNQLIVTNGGVVASSVGVIGPNPGRNNAACITGPGSIWTNSSSLAVGGYGPYSLLIITNGGKLLSNGGGLGTTGPSSSNNLAVITGAGSSWNNGGTLYVGQNSSGNELDVLNGAVLTDTAGSIGQSASSSSNVVLVSGAGSLWTNSTSLTVGYGGANNVLIVTNGGNVFSSGGVSEVGNGFGATNNLVLVTGAGSRWSSGYTYLGADIAFIAREQIRVINGGAFTSSSVLDIGVYSISNTFTVADTNSMAQCQSYRMGYSSTGNQCVVSNGATLAVVSSSQPTVIEGTFTTATVTGAGSVWTNAGDLDFGQFSNVLAITCGGKMVDANGYIENGSGKPNTVIVAGTNSLWKNLADLHVADLGAQLLITNGGTVVDGKGYLGDNAGNNKCYALISGSGSVWSNSDLYIGNNGASNQLVVADGGTVDTGNLDIGYTGSSMNNLLIVNGGSVIVAYDGATISGSMSDQRGTLTLNSGLISCVMLNVAFNASPSNQFNFNGGTLQALTIDINNGLPLIVGNGINAATLDLLGGTCGSPQGLMISSNALFTGSGSVRANVLVGNGGTIAPGTTNLGNVVINGNLTLNNGSTTLVKLNAVNTPGTSPSDTITGVTNLVYGGTLSLTNLTGKLTGGIYAFHLFSAANYSGAFSSLVPAAPPAFSALRWDTYELNVDGVLRVFPAVSTPPVISGTSFDGSNIIIGAGSGIAYDPCWLLTCTNLAAPNWSIATTNYFDVNGNTTFTNAVSTDEPARYFKLQVN